MSSSARQAEDMLQSIVSCQRQRDETRREVWLIGRFSSHLLSRSPAAMFQAGRPYQSIMFTPPTPARAKTEAGRGKIIVGEELVRLIW